MLGIERITAQSSFRIIGVETGVRCSVTNTSEIRFIAKQLLLPANHRLMIKNYLLVALRHLQRRKGYAVLNIAGMFVGMTAFFLIALFVRDELSFDSFNHQADRIYRLTLDGTSKDGPVNTAFSATNWAPVLESDLPEVQRAVRIKPPNQMWMVVHDEKKFYEKGFIFADSTVFDVFDFEFVQGRDSDALAVPFSVVISESMAKKYFGFEDPIGQRLKLDAQYEFTVTGVMRDIPRNAHFKADFLASLSSLRAPIYGDNYLDQPLVIQIYTYLLLAPETDIADVSGKIQSYFERSVGVQLASIGVSIRPVLQPLRSIHLDSHLDNEIGPNGSRSAVLILVAIAVFILLIACINYMNLATARSTTRSREVGLRKVLGAERAQLIRQFLGESVILAGIAVVLSIVGLAAALPVFNSLTDKSLSILSAGILPSAAFFVGVVLIAGVVAGSYPAFFLSGFRPASVLQASSSGSSGSKALRHGLVVFQFAVSIVMIAATAVVFRQLEFLRSKHLGFDKENVLVIQLTDPILRNQYRNLRARVEALPSVESVSASSSAPGQVVQNFFLSPEGSNPEDQTFLQSFFSDYDLAESLHLELIAGRFHSRDFPADTLGRFVLNERAVQTMGFSSPEDAIGRRLTTQGPFGGPVIGVVKDFHAESLHQAIEPAAITIGPDQTFQYFFIRTRSDRSLEAIQDVGSIWETMYPDYVFQYSFLDEDVDRLYAADKQLGNLFGSFAFLTITIACLGLFGLASFTAEQRTREIGLRKVLGSSIASIIALLMRDFAKYIVGAFVIATPIAYFGMNRWLDTFEYRTSFGVGTLLAVGLLALIISMVTVIFQSIRAATANPIDSLRHE